MKTFMAKSEKHMVYSATVGPGDCVFVPAGYLFFERVSGADFLGIRQPVLSIKSLPILKEINSKLETPSAPLLRAVDCLTIASD